VFTLHWGPNQTNTSSETVWNGWMTSPAVRCPSADSSRQEVQLHWRLSHRSWRASGWREVYECQPSAVFLGKCYWRGNSHQPGSWKHELLNLVVTLTVETVTRTVMLTIKIYHLSFWGWYPGPCKSPPELGHRTNFHFACQHSHCSCFKKLPQVSV